MNRRARCGALAAALAGMLIAGQVLAGAAKADRVPPRVTVDSPTEGASVAGARVLVRVKASDNGGIAGVQFRLDGANLGEEVRTAPYQARWDTRTAAEGWHRLTAVVRDLAGNKSTASVRVKVSNFNVTVQRPAAGSSVSGRATIVAKTGGPVAGVQFKVDGVKLGAEITKAPYRIVWDSRFGADGEHRLTAVARDAKGRQKVSSIVVNVTNSTRIFQPAADTEVRSDLPTVNFGTAQMMGLGSSPSRVAYLRFNVALPNGRAVKKATLKLFMTSTSSTGIAVRHVANTTWGESATTFQNAPAIGAQVSASGSFTANQYVSMDVTPLIGGRGLVSLALTRADTVPLALHAREASAKRPVLVVETVAGSPYGSLPIGSAEYPVPADAVFVSQSGSNSGSGSLSSPWRTIQHAVNVAPSGRTIVVREGAYHETVRIPSNRRFTIQAYPNEAVWLDGSTIVGGWVRSGSVWVKTGWTAAFDSTPGFQAGRPDYRFINSDYPMAAHPDQVWVDDIPLAQVGSASQVTAGKFHVDYAADRLTIGTDPTGRTVTASDLSDGVVISGPGSKLLGIGVRKYATPSTSVATVRIGAPDVTLENVNVSQNANVGIIAARVNARLNQVTVEHNGLMGVAGNEADNLLVTNLLSRFNNAENYNMSPAAGGIKITRTRGITIRDSLFANNLANGLWIDESSYNSKIINNKMIGNERNGMTYEISSLAVIADNEFADNKAVAIKINDATNIRIYNNTLTDNGQNLWFAQDHRRATDLSIPGHDMRQPQPDPTVTWLLGNVEFKNNLVSSSTGMYSQYASYIRDYTDERTCAEMNIQLDGNQFEPQGPGAFMVWGIVSGNHKVAVYQTLGAFKGATGQGPGNGETAGTTAPLGLPADIAELVGVSQGTKHIGAFE